MRNRTATGAVASPTSGSGAKAPLEAAADALTEAAGRLERRAALQMGRDGSEGPASGWGWRTIAKALYAEADALKDAAEQVVGREAPGGDRAKEAALSDLFKRPAPVLTSAETPAADASGGSRQVNQESESGGTEHG